MNIINLDEYREYRKRQAGQRVICTVLFLEHGGDVSAGMVQEPGVDLPPERLTALLRAAADAVAAAHGQPVLSGILLGAQGVVAHLQRQRRRLIVAQWVTGAVALGALAGLAWVVWS